MKNIKQLIEQKRRSSNLLWRMLVRTKDFLWFIKNRSKRNLLWLTGKLIVTDHFKEWAPKDGDVYLDVGAGGRDIISTFKQRFSGIKIKIIAIEPNPKEASVIRESNPEITVVQKGAWNKKSKAVLSLPDTNSGYLGAVSENKNSGTGTVCFNIEVDTLDNILTDLGISDVDFVKIDTEGAEPQVLLGFTKYKKGTKFHIEFHRNEDQVFGVLRDKKIDITKIIRWPEDIKQKVTAGQGEIFAEKN
jgi:FkbM family methyltransferase